MDKKKFNGERLKSARIYRGLTITELAEKIEVSKQAVSQYENNAVIPSFETLFAITNFLKFPREHFFQEKLPVKTGTTYFRALLTINKKDRLTQLEKLDYLITIYKILNNYINFPKLNFPYIDSQKEASIEKIAQKVREHWGINNNPIKDIIYLLEKNGIIITAHQTNTNDVDAFSHLAENKYIVVLSKNKKSAVRTQFDAAHELGHMLLHPWSEDIEAIPRETFKEQEKQATEFASAFLLPKEGFLQDIILYPTDLNYYIQLKKKWRTSISAMVIRAYQLDVLTYNQYQYLMRQISKKGWRKKEPLDERIPVAEPSLLNKSIDLLLDNEVFTEEEFLKELSDNNVSLEPKEVELLLNLPTNKLSPKKKESSKIIELDLKQKKE